MLRRPTQLAPRFRARRGHHPQCKHARGLQEHGQDGHARQGWSTGRRRLDTRSRENIADKAQIWDAINDGTIYSVPSLLSSFVILSYADLKKYKFTYWFAFPALHSDPQWRRCGPSERFSADESTALVDKVGTWRYSVDSREHGFFLAKKVRGRAVETDDDDCEFGHKLDFDWEIASLRNYEAGFFDRVADEDRYVAFVDPSTYPEGPGWPLRNLLVLIRQRFRVSKVKILCYRDTWAKRHEARSVVLPIQMEAVETMKLSEMPKVTGWERSRNGKLQAQQVNLGEYMDPARLADSSVDLNLKLMKWRIAPGLDLDGIKNTKCLLLGAGTLGGYVSRNLLGWGVRKITLVDSGRVSFSNPVRQPLFEFNDCTEGGKHKAVQAAAMLKRIYPGVEAEGHSLSVPMLGHPFTDEAQTRSDLEKLEKLVEAHDVIFLLMDTRESRWLPTVMGKAAGKIVMNAALGFDSYVVMRHGSETAPGETGLGCYFCNDVVAPADVRAPVAAETGAKSLLLTATVYEGPDARPAVHGDSAWRGGHCLGAPRGASHEPFAAPSRQGRAGATGEAGCGAGARPAGASARPRAPSDPRLRVHV